MINKISFKLKKIDKILLMAALLSLFIIFLLAPKFQYAISSSFFGLNKDFTDKDIIIVALDEKTLNSEMFKRYQDITRCDHADLIRNIEYWEPKSIWIDIFFDQKSDKQECDNKLQNEIKKYNNVILWTEYDPTKWVKKYLFWGEKETENIAYVDTKSYNDLDILDIFKNSDYKNKIPIYYDWLNPILPFSFAVYKLANWIKNTQINNDLVQLDNNIFPYSKGYFDINYFTDKFKTVSFIDVIENRVNTDIFKNKVVFVWSTAADIHDEFLTPYNTTSFMPWIIIHANMYNTLSKNKLLNYSSIFGLLIINLLLFCIYIFILLKTKNIVSWIIFSFSALVLFIILCLLIFYFSWYFIEIVPSILLFICANIWIYLKKYFEEKNSKDEVKAMFSRYISEDVVNELIKNGTDKLKLGWHEREISVFFSDMVWFTGLSENLKPDELGHILNVYFEEMSGIILKEKWTIDKFIWDAIMAFWNAPLDLPRHANNACTAALLQRQALDKVRDEIKALWYDSIIDMRIWINSWNAVVWNFWCSRRYDYTALWDTVNLASRLESINKQYGTNIIISESTFNAIWKDRFIVRELDLITVKWKSKPVKIYELMWHINLKESENLKTINQAFIFDKALNLYKSRDFLVAKQIFEKIWDNPSKVFMDRCDEFIKNPPDEDWDWVYRFKIK